MQNSTGSNLNSYCIEINKFLDSVILYKVLEYLNDFIVLIFTGSEKAVRAKIDTWNVPTVRQDVMAE